MGLLSSVGSRIVEAIDDLLADTGDWASSILDAGAHIYNKFVDVAHAIVTKDIHDPTFQDFWNVIENLNSVVVVIASVLLVLMFLYTLVQTSLQPRQEVDLKSVAKDFIKMILCNLLITQAINIVSAIFTFGTRLARLVVGATDSSLVDSDRGIGENLSFAFERGVSGISGLLIVILSLIGAVIMVSSALMIVMEIYKRFFRIFVLIPFASISFSTSVMADGHGNEVFKGYLKHIIAAAFESVIIVLCLVFCASLTVPKNEGEDMSPFMQSLFAFASEDATVHTMELKSEDELDDFKQYARTLCWFMHGQDEKEKLVAESNYTELGVFDMYRIECPNGYEKTDNQTDNELLNIFRTTLDIYDPVYPVKVTVGRKVSLGGGLILILQAVFPMILTASAIKEAPQYASRILGL